MAMKKSTTSKSTITKSKKNYTKAPKKADALGSSVTIDLVGCDETFLKELDILRSLARTGVEMVHGTEQKCLAFYRRYSSDVPVGGVTVFVGMKEGNIILTTDSIKKIATIDITSIEKDLKMQPAVGYFLNQIPHKNKSVVYSDRIPSP
jgi:S-adenosylmethionine/arginine decarboxylase-like enzyme